MNFLRKENKQPRILVRAGADWSEPLEPLQVNSGEPFKIETDLFQGEVYVNIEDFKGPAIDGLEGPSTPPERMRKYADNDPWTWSIVIRGQFKEAHTADDIMWGNCWKRPIRDHLPYGTSAALKFIQLIDPALAHDIFADQPWALSPLLATMQTVSIDMDVPLPPSKLADAPEENFPEDLFVDNPKDFHLKKGDRAQRYKVMANEDNRKKYAVRPSDTITCNFANGYIDFSTLSLKLPIGLSFHLVKYWDGQPVTFVCRNRKGDKNYVYVSFEIVEEDFKDPSLAEIIQKRSAKPSPATEKAAEST